ncbi:proteasome subunit alpha type-4 [Thecamonas trahens ATCC 50062]|uniref:Proteasome subunit alpha type-4 n=1 Tax=Thecamonas trahens ATCC 50062 TaxID=461836 RepID=A0A0L0DFY2_THETB|nr:proteasome subunit alpha type-4 [Thecamonas trahens ATCC 50062]KNC51214.1 proteasome subunit alpha type-4 [Thecamonas trahens ATCC 50062]|eukprot:XP_013756411.1 proteasome subunit alpha type-4 [Thecamonas trahens ATCC 50062]
MPVQAATVAKTDEDGTLDSSTQRSMARRYDSRTTIFSPEGRLYQVEYAMEAISQAGACVGILTSDGIVLAAEKKVTSPLLEPSVNAEKMYRIDAQTAVAVAGMTSDANILVNYARQVGQRYLFSYRKDIPVEQLVRQVCDLKQGYTQYGGLRPFGVSFLYAGWDRLHGYQLYKSDPSGNFGGWKATAIGSNYQNARSTLKQKYEEEMTLDDAKTLAIRVLSKAMDATTMDAEKVELAVLTRVDGAVTLKHLSGDDVAAAIAAFEVIREKEQAEGEGSSASGSGGNGEGAGSGAAAANADDPPPEDEDYA